MYIMHLFYIFICTYIYYMLPVLMYIYSLYIEKYIWAQITYIIYSSEIAVRFLQESDRHFRSIGFCHKPFRFVQGSGCLGLLPSSSQKEQMIKVYPRHHTEPPCLLLCFWLFSFWTQQFFSWKFSLIFVLEQ